MVKPDSEDPTKGDQPSAPMDDGLVFNQRVLEKQNNSQDPNQQLLVSDEDGSDLDDLFAGFSKKERKKILRKLAKMNSGSDSEEEVKKKKKSRSKGKDRKHRRGRKHYIEYWSAAISCVYSHPYM